MSEGSGVVHGEEPLPLLFIFVVLLLGAVAKHTLSNLPLPYTCLLLIFGVLVGLVDSAEDLKTFERSADFLAKINPHVILYIFLPPLIFESSFSIEWHMFKNIGLSSMISAVPGLMFGMLLLSLVMRTLYQWEYIICVLFGAIASATDPVAVVALLKDVGAPPALAAFIEGESLLNDGTAMVAFTIMHEAAKHNVFDYSFADVVWEFVRMSIGGPLFGLICGVIWIKWIGYVFNDALVEITATITAAYLCFFIAEFYLHASGVLAVVALGLMFGSVGRTSISPEVEHFLQEFWEFLGYLANTLIFVLTGLIIVTNNVKDLELNDFIYLGLIYVSANIIRFMMLMICYPAISRIGYGIDYKGIIVSSWGGLRGAVGLSLALVVFQDKEVQAANTITVNDGTIDGKYVTDRVLFHCSGIVMLTLLINATTMKSLLSWLGMDKVSHSKEVLFNLAMKEIENAGKREETHLKLNPIYACARWRDVRHFKFKVNKVKVRRLDRNASAWEIDQAEREEARRRFLVAVKSSYWQQFKDGILGRQAVRELNELTDRSLDNLSDMSEWEGLHKILSVSKSSHVVHRFLNVPGFQALTRRFLFHRLQYGYDCVTSFVVARQEALKKITDTLDSDTLFGEIKSHANADIAKAKKALFDIQRVLPEISASIATNAAARCVLNSQRRAVQHLLHDGLLDVKEAERVIVAIEAQMKRLLYTPPSMQLPEKEQLLGEVPFLAALDKPVRQMVLDKATEIMFEEGDHIVKCGDTDDDVFVIARGTVRVIKGSGSETVVMDELGVGSFIGEMSWVTGSPRFATVLASSPVICFCLRGSDLREIVKNAREMEVELWHTAGCRLAENMLSQRPPYSYWNRSNLRRWIYTKWELFMPEYDSLIQTYREPIVLIHGHVEMLPLKDRKKKNKKGKKGSLDDLDDGFVSASSLANAKSNMDDRTASIDFMKLTGLRVKSNKIHIPLLMPNKSKKKDRDSESNYSGDPPYVDPAMDGRVVHKAPFLIQASAYQSMYRVHFSPDAKVLIPPHAVVNEKATLRWKDAYERLVNSGDQKDKLAEGKSPLYGVAKQLDSLQQNVKSQLGKKKNGFLGVELPKRPTNSRKVAPISGEPQDESSTNGSQNNMTPLEESAKLPGAIVNAEKSSIEEVAGVPLLNGELEMSPKTNTIQTKALPGSAVLPTINSRRRSSETRFTKSRPLARNLSGSNVLS